LFRKIAGTFVIVIFFSLVMPQIANALCPYGDVISLSIGVSKYDQVCNNQYQRFKFPVTSGRQYKVTVTPTSSSYDTDLYVGATSSVSDTTNYFASSTNGSGNVDTVTFTASSSTSTSGYAYAAVKAYSSGTLSYYIKVEDVTVSPPNTPSTPSLTQISNGIRVSWGSVSGATSYKVYWGTNSSVSETYYSGILTTSSLIYDHTGLSNGSTYYYRVMACNSAGCSGLSGIRSKTYAVVPGTPSTPSLTQISNGIRISWGSVSGATSYKVYWGTNSSVSETYYSGILTTSSLVYDHTGLSNGSTYYYRVMACNSAGCSGLSGIRSKTYAVVPGIPSTPSLTQISNGIRISWGSVSGATSYKIYWGTNSSVSETYYSGILTTSSLVYDHTGLSNGSTYYYRVMACNSAGCSGLSGINSKTYAVTPGTPSTPSLTQISNGIRVSWGTVSGATSYKIYWGTNNTVSETYYCGILTTSSLVYDHTNLDSGQIYYYRVMACNSFGCSGLSEIQSASAPKADLTISMQTLPSDLNLRNAQRETTYPITCTISHTGGLLRPTSDFVRVYVYMNQDTDPMTVTPEHLVLGDTGSTMDVPVTNLDDSSETISGFNIPVPADIEGPHFIHLKVDGPEYWNESNESNNWATSSDTVAVWRDEVPTTASDNGILARTWDNPDIYWISKYGKKWPLTGIELDPNNSNPGYIMEQLGYTDPEVHWYRSGALDGVGLAREILKDNDNFVYRKQGSSPEESTVYIVRNGVSDWFLNWDAFINSEFGTEDVYWAKESGFAWIQLYYPPGQMIGLQPRIRVAPIKLIFD